MEALGIIWEVAKSLFSCTNAQAAYVYKLQENLESLKEKWDDLQNKEKDVQTEIDRAESTGVKKRTNEGIGWLQEFQKLQEKMMKDIPNFQEVQSNRCLNGYCPKNFVSSYKLGKKIVESLNEVNAMLSKADKTQFAIEQPPKLVAEIPCGETIGLDLMVDKIWHSLEDDNVGIIGLYGMGGAGKTTLMKRIQSEFGKREHCFDLVLWAVVSKDCDINKIMTDISNKLGIDESFWKRSSEDQRVAKIHERLKGKKFVLMLDDLWGKLELQAIGVPVPKESNNKSKVVFTTRFEDVCAKMKTETKLEVRCLYDKEAFELFCNKVGDETLKCHTEIPKLAHEMAKECGGLPLALITVGSAMAGVESYDAWMDARNNLRSSPSKASDFVKVFRILKFSYDKLPDKAHKSCFLYCALYPEDFELDGDELIDRWIGEGFLDKDGKSIHDMYNQGKSIIEKLILSCLLEEGIGSELNFLTGWYKRKIKMHDVIRDMALWLARDEDENKDKIVVQGEAISISEMDSKRLNVVERISIITRDTKLLEESWKIPTCPNLITLCLNLGEGHPLSLNFQSIKRLRVLDLSRNRCIINLSSEIGELINSEFLNLSGSKVLELPIALKKLKKLRVFLMDGMTCTSTSSNPIPLEVIESLEQLKVFRFSRGDDIENTVQEEISLLEKLESLPKLEALSIELTSITSVQRLLHSTKLRGCTRRISISGWKKEDNKSVEMFSLLTSMSEMNHLESIYLSSTDSLVDGSSITDKCHLGMLRQVCINFCGSITHLTWLRYAPLLEVLVVSVCDSIEEVVKEAKDDEQADNIFTNLKILGLFYMPKLVSIHKRALDFPSLKRFEVAKCPNLRKLPLNSSFALKNNLIAIKGETEWWDKLEWDDTIIPTLLRPKLQW
ncbi:putative P-loop containing nucleoside triphosphate hydrolase, leucine-rich repeat domain, L [Medicago truncatula]|uniref:LRR and NB-ARC domain disease resistance protein, putative n=1 Tax=Medicago truncatula TaxID=3880 RepID=G7JRW4_MEDTR|nr:probable disease resistance protein At5g63020 [Medicago truncatula]AES90455.1 LRR and NB-ARC domain disease resistance protein, putative [Medicago truncatula]RHN62527.1 putative P-loop containing nucleoside triphosphate hydrolase, leucine-rich repeat domain, L [Medicago truncatula]